MGVTAGLKSGNAVTGPGGPDQALDAAYMSGYGRPRQAVAVREPFDGGAGDEGT